MSHEIRTPLNLIIGSADLLLQTNLNPQQRKLVNVFSKASDHLLTLIDNILEISQIEAKGLTVNDAFIQIEDIGFDVCEIISTLCRQKKLGFDYYIQPPGDYLVSIDKTRIKQLILNLLNNSVKFTEQGEIRFTLKTESINVSWAELYICVSDTGIGMSENEISQLFNPFYQAKSGLSRTFKGTGLGLSIVKAITDHYRGEIKISSKKHLGTEFHIKITLPKLKLERNDSRLLDKKEILMCIPSNMESITLSDSLAAQGAKIQIARNNKILIESTAKAEFDWYFVDLQDPNKALEALIQSKETNRIKDRIIVFLPAIHRVSDLPYLSSLGIQKFIYKPFTLNKFMDLISPRNVSITPRIEERMLHPLELLVVDDDEENRALIELYLAQTPYNAEYAKDGHSAIKIAEKKKFDLILMDIEMPELNGYDTAKILNRKKNKTNPKILGLSANAFKENVEMAKRSGFSGYITKPIRKDNLIFAISTCYGNDKFFTM